MTGNYVDTRLTRTVDLGPCRCPLEEPPHERDSAEVRERLAYAELAIFREAGWRRSGGATFSNEDAKMALLTLGVKAWTLTLPDGSPRPVDADQVGLLDEATVDLLWTALAPAVRADPLPKGSAGRSPAGTRASTTSTRKTRTRQPSTTA